MKCEHCNNDMVWVGSLRDGKLECETCAALTEYCNKDGCGVELYKGGIIWCDDTFVCTSESDDDMIDYDI